MLPFALPERQGGKPMSGAVRERGGRLSSRPSAARGLLGMITLLLYCVALVSIYSNVPYHLVGDSDWTVGAMMTLGSWVLTVAAVPAFLCLLSETFLYPVSSCLLARAQVLRIARICELGTWLVPRSQMKRPH